MSFHVCKILFKLAQVSACYCKMLRGLLFRGHSAIQLLCSYAVFSMKKRRHISNPAVWHIAWLCFYVTGTPCVFQAVLQLMCYIVLYIYYWLTYCQRICDELRRPADTQARRRLRSASSMTRDVRRTRLSTVGDRALPVAVARLWNSLPPHVTAAPSLSIFCCHHKLHLFSLSYPAFWLFSHLYHCGHCSRYYI